MAESEFEPGQTTAGDSCFRTTHWSVVLNMKDGDAHEASQALARLCHTYWYPLYAFVRRQGNGPQDAKDLIQGFFARMVEKKNLQNADRARGKFRSFLLVALKRYMANEWLRDHREKRGGYAETLPLESLELEERYLAEPAADLNPERAFDRRWALAVLSRVLRLLSDEFTAAGQMKVFNELESFLTGEAEPSSYANTALQLGMSQGALRITVHRMRMRFRELLRQEIAGTVDGPEDIDEEIRELHAALR
jgi:RNA polymerase sigma-70 factor (ECF subfamily)